MAEAAGNRKKQMDKRFRKLQYVHFDTPVFTDAPNEEADVLLVGFGSTKGAIEEIRPMLDAEGIKTNHAHIRLIHPFPIECCCRIISFSSEWKKRKKSLLLKIMRQVN